MPGFFRNISTAVGADVLGTAAGFGVSFLKEAVPTLVKNSVALAVFETAGIPAAAAFTTVLILGCAGAVTKKGAANGFVLGTVTGAAIELAAKHVIGLDPKLLSNSYVWEAAKSAASATMATIAGVWQTACQSGCCTCCKSKMDIENQNPSPSSPLLQNPM